MSIEQDLYSGLTGHAGLAALVGLRVYPMGEAPQGVARPYVTYTRVSGPRERGLSETPIATTARIQVDAWGATAKSAQDVIAQVRAAVLSLPAVTVSIYDRSLEGRGDQYESDTKLYRASEDALLLHGGA